MQGESCNIGSRLNVVGVAGRNVQGESSQQRGSENVRPVNRCKLSETHILPLGVGGETLNITIAERKIIQSHKSVEVRAEGHGRSDKGKLVSPG